MHWFGDRSGFPMLELPDGAGVALWPVCKAQFERFLAEPGGLGNRCYEELLAQNPRRSWRRWADADREKLFVTGVQPAEASAYCAWLGNDFDLPTVALWRQAYRVLADQPLDEASWVSFMQCTMSPVAREIAPRLRRQVQPQTWAEFALLTGGVLEWVRGGNTDFVGLGKPRPAFFSLLLQPGEELLRPLSPERFYYFGFRPVRRPRLDLEEERP